MLSQPSIWADKHRGANPVRENNFCFYLEELGFQMVEPVSIAFIPFSILLMFSPGHRKTAGVYSKRQKLKTPVNQPMDQRKDPENQKASQRLQRGKKSKPVQLVYEFLGSLLTWRCISMILFSIPKTVRSKPIDKPPSRIQIHPWVGHMWTISK